MIKVIIPTDFSENAMHAIRYTMELLKYERSDFLIVHAYADEVYENTMEMSREFYQEFKKKVKVNSDRQLHTTVQEIVAHSPNPKHKYEYTSVFGSLVDVMNDLANTHNADLIVMGTKGKTNNRDITFGSQTHQVIRYVKCPVLAVPVGFEEDVPKRMLFPTNYMVPYRKRELKLVSTLARNFAATITFLHVTKAKELSFRQADNRDKIASCTEVNLTDSIALPGDHVAVAINQFIEDNDINFLILVNSRYSFLENLLRDSTIEKMALQGTIPLLVLQNITR